MTDIRHIVFDIGKVLIHYDPHLAFLDLIPGDAEREAFLRDVCSNEWNVEQDRGRTWADAEAEAIALHPGKAALIRGFRENWHRMVPHAYEETVTILRELIAAGYDVTMLTNFAPDTFREAQAIYPFLTESRGVTVSGEVGLIKPDPEIYRRHAERFGLDPATTLFFDDSPANVEAARGAGWNAELFQGAEKMRSDLARYGITLQDLGGEDGKRGTNMPAAINLQQKLGLFSEHWSPKIVASYNGNDVIVVKLKGEFVWHSHPETDDFFLVLKGNLVIELRDGEVKLGPGDLYVVPKGVEHRPVAEEEVHLLLIEPHGTPNTGDPTTAAVKESI